jgi:queuine/archaeosine tRNA-ribosyltransferase
MNLATIGYFVTDGKSVPLCLGDDGVLWIDDPVTAFTSYERARTAVRRSYKWAARNDYTWGHGFRIRRLVYGKPKERE